MTGHNPELWKRTKSTLQTDFLVREKIPLWLGDVKNKMVLDVGCGEGYVSRMLAKLGADVNAFDYDPKMISLAQSLENRLKQGIKYRVGNILDLKDLYKENEFDIVLLSGVPPFFDEVSLLKVCKNIFHVLKRSGIMLLTTNHTKSYFENTKSNWMKFLSNPNPKSETQKFKLDFYTPDKQKAFSGEAWIHTPKQIKTLLKKSGFQINRVYEPLATKDDMNHFPEMWGDEDKIPFHLVVIAEK